MTYAIKEFTWLAPRFYDGVTSRLVHEVRGAWSNDERIRHINNAIRASRNARLRAAQASTAKFVTYYEPFYWQRPAYMMGGMYQVRSAEHYTTAEMCRFGDLNPRWTDSWVTVYEEKGRVVA